MLTEHQLLVFWLELFVLLLFGTSAALVGVCELVFLRDIFQDLGA